MEGIPRIGEMSPKLLNLMPNGTPVRGCPEEKKLELRLGPPVAEEEEFFPTRSRTMIPSQTNLKVLGRGDFSQPCYSRGLVVELQDSGMKDGLLASSTSQKRTAPGPLVGWPPIRSFRKNITTTSNNCPKPPPPPPPAQSVALASTKLACESPTSEKNMNSNSGVVGDQTKRSMFVKINMEGVAIGRKVNLGAYDSYDKLSSAVDDLFRGLLAAQNDCGVDLKAEEEWPITGVLDGRGEYTLVYEDNEGDRMLVGDVPWHMFVSTVKRLRVLKTSELSSLGIGGDKHDKILPNK